MKIKHTIPLILCLLLGSLILSSTAALDAEECNPAYVAETDTVITVSPTKTNDTTNLQCAFDTAIANGPDIDVHLIAGDFYTEQLVATSFQGDFTGAGQDVTKLTNLPDLYVTPEEMYLNPPSVDNPWASLIAFVDGNFTVSDMTVHITGESPTTGWSIWGAFDPPLVEMAHAIVILGSEAHANFEDVTIEGEPTAHPTYPFLNYNLINGIFYEGFIGEPPPPISGTFRVQRSTFRHVLSGTPALNVNQTAVIISHNTFENVDMAMDGGDFTDSLFVFSSNKVEAPIGFDLYNMYNTEDTGNFYLIRNNRFLGENGPMFNMTMGENNRCLFLGNNTKHVTDVGIYLGEGTRDCAVFGYHQNVVDLGTNNKVHGKNFSFD